ncbi:hypothetical protein GOFOIKOB_1859 [Methylobacterium tardum]|uniref:Uncharacterized protein n=1 Tax=Methylobacterium tardum TaxID=374432 RepID=A0AA37TQN5_9HYPH|nr:hypothetical protein [Methylobacterium tardum]URD39300.1 hypothetical protein M6G65_13345 [Methylobacterium tardum]GJE48825.1 hypothetical protein GOFOIKOB_1859 [Methylobacterium tardum]GLS73966.1 hypothetical protein GCM10007890_59810 [Methylobacterium tardum]
MRTALAALALVVAAGGGIDRAWAWDACEAIALRDVPAIEAPDSILAKGDIDAAITQYRVSKATKRAVFCSHGGYCYPTHVTIKGEKVEALRLTNCKIGSKSDYQDDEDTFYPVDIIREKFTPAQLRRYDTEDTLSQMGLCSACVGDVAGQYLSKPESRCGRLVKSAFEGNPKAKDALQNPPNACQRE